MLPHTLTHSLNVLFGCICQFYTFSLSGQWLQLLEIEVVGSPLNPLPAQFAFIPLMVDFNLAYVGIES